MSNELSAIKTMVERIGNGLPPKHYFVSQQQAKGEHVGNILRSLASVHANADPTVPQAARDKAIIQKAQLSKAALQKTRDAIHTDYAKALEANVAAKKAKVDMRPDVTYLVPTMNRLYDMPQAEKWAFCDQLIASKNLGLLAAILGAPLPVSGLSAEMHQRLSVEPFKRYASQELAEEAGLQQAFLTTLDCVDIALKGVKEFENPVRLYEIEKAEFAANTAKSEFDASIRTQPVYAAWKEGDPYPTSGGV